MSQILTPDKPGYWDSDDQHRIRLHPKQAQIYRAPHRFRVGVAGRRFGKTKTAISDMLRAAQKRKQKIWYVAPTFPMAKQIMWDDLKDSVPRRWVNKYNETSMSIRLINGSLIELRGADRPDTLRGVGLNFVVLDEAQDMKDDVWEKIIYPTLMSTSGRALILGTPKGYNLLYTLWQRGQKKSLQIGGEWISWQFKTSDSPFIPFAEIERARRDLDPRTFRQEFEASFETIAGRVYYPFKRETHVGNYPFNPRLPIWIGMDFNIDPMSCAIMQPQPNGEVWVVDELVLFNSSTSEMCEAIDQRYFRYMRQIAIYPDAAGGQRQHARGESDLDILKERGFTRLKVKKANPAVADRINATNTMLETGDGRHRLRVDRSCRHVIEACEKTLYKSGGRDVDKGPGIEHVMDGVGYCMDYEFPLRKIILTGYSR